MTEQLANPTAFEHSARLWRRHLNKRKSIRVTKEELRMELEKQANRFKTVYGGEIITYAAQPEPEKKPWRKKQTVHDQVFQKELEKIEKELAQQATESQ